MLEKRREFEELIIHDEEWGLRLEVKKGVEVNNLNMLSRIEPIIQIAKEKGKKRILVEAADAKRNVTIIKLFQAGELLLKLRTAGFRIAFVAPRYVNSKESRFMENIGFNRGSFVRYFSETAEAMDWLVAK